MSRLGRRRPAYPHFTGTIASAPKQTAHSRAVADFLLSQYEELVGVPAPSTHWPLRGDLTEDTAGLVPLEHQEYNGVDSVLRGPSILPRDQGRPEGSARFPGYSPYGFPAYLKATADQYDFVGQDFSINLWIRLEDATESGQQFQRIIEKRDANSPNEGWLFYFVDGGNGTASVEFDFDTASGSDGIGVGTNTKSGVPQMLTFAWDDSSSTMHMWADGVLLSSHSSWSVTPDWAGHASVIRLGAPSSAGEPTGNLLRGDMQHVSLWEGYTVTQADVDKLYAQAFGHETVSVSVTASGVSRTANDTLVTMTDTVASRRNRTMGDSLVGVSPKQVATTNISASTTTPDLTNVTAPVAGDLLIAALVTDATHTVTTPPAGWTHIISQDDPTTGSTMSLYYKIAGGSEPGTYTDFLTLSVADIGIAGIMSFSGVDAQTVLDVAVSGAANASAMRQDTPAITPTTVGAQLVGFFGFDASGARSFVWDPLITRLLEYQPNIWGHLSAGSRRWSGGAQSLGANFTLPGGSSPTAAVIVGLRPAVSDTVASSRARRLTDTLATVSDNLVKQGAVAVAATDTLTTMSDTVASRRTRPVHDSLAFMSYEQTVLTDGPLGFYRLDETAGTNADDKSPNGADLTYTGTYTQGVAGPTADGRPGVQFATSTGSAVNGYVTGELPAAINVADGTDVTVALWANWNGAQEDGDVVSFWTGSGNYALWLVGSVATDVFGFNTMNSDLFGVDVAGNLTADTWHHVVATFRNGDRNSCRLWIDGVEKTLVQKFNTPGSGDNADQTFAIGAGQAPQYGWDGRVASVSVFNGVLSQARIDAHRAQGLTAVGDGIAVTKTKPRAVADTLATMTDTVVSLRRRMLTDTAATVSGDSIAKAKRFIRTASDTACTMTDTVVSRRTRQLADTAVTPSDSIAKAHRRVRTATDTIATVTDSLVSRRTRVFADTLVTPGDSIAKTQTRIRALTDTLSTVTDSLVARRTRALTDTIATVTDSLTTRRVRAVSDTAVESSRVRTFDGVDDRIHFGNGGLIDLSAAPGFTIVTVGRINQSGVWQSLSQAFDTSDSGVWSHEFTNNNFLHLQTGGNEPISSITFDQGEWQLWAVSREMGFTVTEFHKYDFETATWTRDDEPAGGNADFPLDLNKLWTGAWAFDQDLLGGDLVMQALFANNLLDADLDAIPSMTRAEFLGMSDLVWCVFFDQAAVTVPILDLIGNFDEAVRYGTSVLAEDTPWPVDAVSDTVTSSRARQLTDTLATVTDSIQERPTRQLTDTLVSAGTPQRTGTASQVDAQAASGSVSVTVPADATMVVAFWSAWEPGDVALNTLTLGGSTITELFEVAGTGDKSAIGAGVLTTLPGTGSQTLAWDWEFEVGAIDEGGEIVLVWVKGHNASLPVRDVDAAQFSGPVASPVSVTVDTQASDLVLGFGAAYSDGGPVSPTTTGTAFIDNVVLNDHKYDATEVTAESDGSTTITVSDATYMAVAAVSLPAAAVTDTIAGGKFVPRAASDTLVTPSDAIAIQKAFGRSLTDTLATVTDAVASRRIRQLADTLATVSDSISRTAYRTVSDTLVTPNDSIARTSIRARAASDTLVTPGDSIAPVRVRTRTIADTAATVTDALASRRHRMLSDQLATIVDSPSPAFFRSATDTLATVTDTLVSRRSRSFTDTAVTPGDSVVRVNITARAVTDTIATVTDSVSSRRTRLVSDTAVTPSDSIARAASLSRALTDTLATVSDSLAVSRLRARTATDTAVTPADSVARTASFARTASDTIATVTDALTIRITRSLSDTLASVSDTLSFVAPRTLTDTLVAAASGACDYDTQSEPTQGFTADTSWTHTPVGIPRGVAVLVVQAMPLAEDPPDEVVGVTYGGQALTRLEFSVDTGTETGAAYLYFLGSGIPTGPQTVNVDLVASPTALNFAAVVFTLTGDSDLVVKASGKRDSIGAGGNIDDPFVVLGTDAAFDGVVLGGMFCGLGLPTNAQPGAGYTKGTADLGNNIAAWQYGDKAGANVNFDWVTSSTDDSALVAAAIGPAVAVADTVSTRITRPLTDTLATVTDTVSARVARTVSDTLVTISDSVAKNGAVFNRDATDTLVTPSDSLASTRTRSLADTLATVTDTLASRPNRQLADTLATVTGDTIAKAKTFSRALADTAATVTETITSNRRRMLSDQLATIVDSPSPAFFRSVTDTISTVTDTLASRRVRAVTDTAATVTDTLASRRVRVLSDTLATVNDAISTEGATSRAVTDTLVEPGDSISRTASHPRAATDTLVTPSDSLASYATRPRSAADTLASVTDAISSLRVRQLTDTLATVDDSISVFRVRARATTDTIITSSDALTRTASHPRVATDTLATVTDALTSLRVRQLTDTLATVTDSLASKPTRALADTLVTASDSIAVTRVFNRAITDELADIVESVDTEGATTKYLADTLVAHNDSLTLRVTRSITDTATAASDSIVKAKTVSRNLTDTAATVSDALASRRHRMLADQLATIVDTPSPATFRSATDTLVTFSDTLRSSRARSLADTLVTLTDALASLRRRQLTDTAATISDAISTAGATARAATDTLVNPGDSIARTASLARTATDTLATVTDSVALSRVRTRSVADTVATVTDSISSARSRTLTDTLATVADSLTATSGIALVDTLAVVSDSLARDLDASRSLTDTLAGVNDSIAVSKRHSDTLNDTAATVSDSLASRRTRQLIDTGAAMSDAIARSLQAYRFSSDIALTMTDQITGTVITSPIDQLVAMSDTLKVNRVGRFMTDTAASFAIPDYIVFQAGTVIRSITDDILDMSDFIEGGANPTLYSPIGIIVADPFTGAVVQDPEVEADPVHDLIGVIS